LKTTAGCSTRNDVTCAESDMNWDSAQSNFKSGTFATLSSRAAQPTASANRRKRGNLARDWTSYSFVGSDGSCERVWLLVTSEILGRESGTFENELVPEISLCH
jgi:hypothetical protein